MWVASSFSCFKAKLRYIERYYSKLISLPVTTFDIPDELLSFIDDLVKAGKARNRREIIVKAMEVFVKLHVQNWNGPLIIIHGVRKGLISKGSIAELVAGMSDDELYKAGKRMGKTLRDLAMNMRLDISQPENHQAALQILEDFGWGRLQLDGERITITNVFLPSAVIHGYLETALAIHLARIDTVEDIIAFELVPVASPTVKRAGHSRQNKYNK